MNIEKDKFRTKVIFFRKHGLKIAFMFLAILLISEYRDYQKAISTASQEIERLQADKKRLEGDLEWSQVEETRLKKVIHTCQYENWALVDTVSFPFEQGLLGFQSSFLEGAMVQRSDYDSCSTKARVWETEVYSDELQSIEIKVFELDERLATSSPYLEKDDPGFESPVIPHKCYEGCPREPVDKYFSDQIRVNQNGITMHLTKESPNPFSFNVGTLVFFDSAGPTGEQRVVFIITRLEQSVFFSQERLAAEDEQVMLNKLYEVADTISWN